MSRGSIPGGPAGPPSLSALFRAFFSSGLQSFGGGAATLTLLQRATVDQRGWLTDAEFTRLWSLCQIAPGINLFALTILIGHKLAGAPGVIVCLLGLLLPSVSITVLMTAAYVKLEHLGLLRSALRGVIPATAGLGLALSKHMGAPLLAESQREGRGRLVWSVVVIVLSGVVAATLRPPVPIILLGAGALLAAVHVASPNRPGEPPA